MLQCCVGPIKMDVGRFKAGPFHSERRLSESSQVIHRTVRIICACSSQTSNRGLTVLHPLFQISETGSFKAASHPCSDSGNLPGDPDKPSAGQECMYPQT